MFNESMYFALIVLAFASFVGGLGFVSWWSGKK